MASIKTYLDAIKAAVYGEEVRGSIHDAIKAIYDISTGAQGSATASANTAIAKASEAVAAAKEATAKAGEAIEAAEQAQTAADNASAVTGIKIATQTTAGILKGGENYIDESGELQLTKRTDFPTLYNSYAGGIKLNELGGVSEQDSTTGKNLTEPLLPTSTSRGVTCTNNRDGSFTLNGTASAMATFRIDQSTINGADNTKAYDGTYRISLRDSNGNENPNGTGIVLMQESTYTIYLDTTSNKKTASVTAENCFIYIIVPSGTTVNNLRVYPQLESGSEMTSWEPYTGNAPSPSLEYPQEIKPVEGKNLLDCRGLTERTVKGVTFTPVYDNNGNLLYAEANGTASEATSYVMKAKVYLPLGKYIVSGGITVFLRDASGNWKETVSSGNTLIITDEATYAEITIYTTSGKVYTNEKFYPMIRPASIADDTYVPYGLLRIWGHGKNFLDNSLMNIVSSNVNYVQLHLKPNSQYTVSSEIPIDDNSAYYFAITGVDASGISSPIHGIWKNNPRTITSDENGIITVAYRSKASTVTVNLADYILQVEKGTEATEIEPYTSQSVTLSTPIKLNGVGTAQDKFVRKDGVLKIERNVPEVVFDGSDDEAWTVGSTNTEELYRLSIPIADIKKNTDADTIPNILSTHFRAVTPRNTFTNVEGISVSTSGILLIYSSAYNTSDVSLWKAHLAENPITIQYEAAQPTYEDLPTADQISLNSLVSYDGITYLYCDSEVQPTWDLEYGTSRAGGYTLEAWNTAMSEKILNEARYNEIVAAMLVMNQE